MQQALHYHQIASIPRKCVVKSRSECDISVDFCDHKFKAPYTPANMAAVVNEDICKQLAFNGYFYIMHRFGDTRKFIQRARAEAWPLVSISVGVKDEDKELIRDISESKCRVHFVTIDIAHGYSDSVAEMIRFIKDNLPSAKVIAGNVWGDKDSIEFLQNAGADAIKVGLSMGKSCLTFPTTSFGSPMFSAALQAGAFAKVPVILDGGVREAGDVARAMIGFMHNQGEVPYGGLYSFKRYPNGIPIVPLVMIGGMFAACIDAPGDNVYENPSMESLKYESEMREAANKAGLFYIPNPVKLKIAHKRFYGSASAENKQRTGQKVEHIEGRSVEIPCNGMTYLEFCESLNQAIKSQVSYAGGKDLTAFKDVQWRIIS